MGTPENRNGRGEYPSGEREGWEVGDPEKGKKRDKKLGGDYSTTMLNILRSKRALGREPRKKGRESGSSPF